MRNLVSISVLGILYSLAAALVWGTVPVVYRFCMVKGSPFKLQAVRAVGFLAFGTALVFIFPGLMKAPVEGVLCAALGTFSSENGSDRDSDSASSSSSAAACC